MYDYFIWNLPLFVHKASIEARLCLRFGKCSIDVSGPKNDKHVTHSGMARVLCNGDYSFGKKSELDLGYRYPAFVKNSDRFMKKSVRFVKSCESNPWNDRVETLDLESDEKSCDSTCSISVCDPKPCLLVTGPDMVISIESTDSNIQSRLHDFEIIREFIKNLQMDLHPHMLPAD